VKKNQKLIPNQKTKLKDLKMAHWMIDHNKKSI
jgi:hypothetical protein